MKGRVRLLYCYASEDETLREALDRHLSSLKLEGLLESWHQQLILAGAEVQSELAAQLEAADLVLLLVSADFMASGACQILAAAALARHQAQQLRLVPVLTRATDWLEGPFGKLSLLPANGRPVTSWSDRDEAWLDVVLGILRMLRQFFRSPERPWAPQNPYRGLEAFEPEDEAFFFGREEVTRRLHGAYAEMNAEPGGVRLLAILGASGSGKSSVARAGLVPALRRHPLPGRLAPHVVILKPGKRPLEKLALALLPLAPAKDEDLAAVRLLELKRLLTGRGEGQEPEGLRVFAQTLPGIEKTGLCVFVDQFEEVYTQDKEDKAKLERDLFIDLLLHAASDAESPVSVVLTLRSDFLGATHQHPALSQALSSRAVVVGVMSEADTQQAIARPAEIAGAPLPGATVSLLLEQTRGCDGTLPLLQFALQRIWEARLDGQDPDKALHYMGGVGGALSREADALLQGLGPAGAPLARALLLAMVKIGRDQADTRRVVTRAEALQAAGGGPTAEDVLVRLSGGRNPEAPPSAPAPPRLVVVRGTEGVENLHVDLAHDALLLRWDTLRGWIEEDRKLLERRDDLEAAALAWEGAGCPAEGLPGGALLGYHQGVGLPDAQRKRLLTLGNVQAQRYLEEAGRSEARRRRRRMWAVGGLAALTATAVVLGGLAGIQWRRAETGQREVQRRLSQLYAEQGRQELLSGRADRALVYLAEALRAGGTGSVLRALIAQGMKEVMKEPQVLDAHTQEVTALALSSDGRSIATSGADGQMQLWTPHGHCTIQNSGVAALSFEKSGAHVLSLSGQVMTVWDAASGARLGKFEHPRTIRSAAFSPDGSRIVTASDDDQARIWSLKEGRIEASLPHQGDVNQAAFSPDGERVVTASWDRTARLWDARTGQQLAVLTGHRGDVVWAAFSVDSTRVVTGSADNTARVWDGRQGQLQLTLLDHEDTVTSAQFARDGRHLITASRDRTARIWDLESGKVVALLRGDQVLLSAEFSQDGRLVMTHGESGAIQIWDSAAGQMIAALPTEARAAALCPDASCVITGGVDGRVRTWSLNSNKSQKPRFGEQGEQRRQPGGSQERRGEPGPRGKIVPSDRPMRRHRGAASQYPEVGHTPQDLRLFAQEAPHARTRERFLALYDITVGHSATEVATLTDREDETVQRWIHRYNAQGPEALVYRRSGAAPPLP